MQVTRITSEALQATIRRLLPSQQGFGEDLEASNVIIPTIDLTPTAEGSALPTDLARAASFGGITSFLINNTTSDIIDATGFYRLHGVASVEVQAGSVELANILINDGTTSKICWGSNNDTGIAGEIINSTFDFVVFLRSQDKLEGTTTNGCRLNGSVWQVADVNGNLTNPSGYVSQ